ncbi:MAG: PDZ domain-containing protein [Acidobacteria bacterium]|nr:PDZ domain-containing protein [Acidobacteriota bacterium]
MTITRRIAPLLVAVLIAAAPCALGQPAPGVIAFTISMPQPSNHLFHVTLRVAGLTGELQDVKMPAWHPGYYRMIDYAKNVSGFRAQDGAGRALPWEKITKNTWRVATGGASTLILSYDILGTVTFSAQNYLGESRAFIAPTGMFLHLAGRLQSAATVSIQLPLGWTRIATGLNPVPGKANMFSAPDFDTLYDCPMLIGNQETLEFDVQGKRHTVAIEHIPASVDRPRMLADLKKLVESAATLMGDLPYTSYTFLMMGNGRGGIEHANSSANSFNGDSLADEGGYRRWLSFICHEYFHHYNVKRIRPIALGPFDYDTENLTDMLWVSEGLSVYYQDLLLVRAGLQTADQYLDKLAGAIDSFENAPGHHYQSATDSSMTTWGTSGVGNDRNTTISYYDNGAMLGAMLDLAIRHESGNRKSLDDVMRALYRKYYQQKRRGFTDDEFRQECESAAGASLTEVLEYASTTRDVDYAKFFAYAGLEVTAVSEDAPGSYLGLNLQTREGKLMIVGASAGSPAERAGLAAQDQILEVDGTLATPKALNDALSARKPGETLTLKVSRDNASLESKVTLAGNRKQAFTLRRVAAPTALQAAIFPDWLRGLR